MTPCYPRTIATQPAAGTLFNTYTTAKTVINPTALYTFQPNEMVVGTELEIEVGMAISNIVTAQPTFTFQVMLGSIVVWTSGAITTNTAAHTLIPSTLKVNLRLDSVGNGTTAKFLGMGVLTGRMWVHSGATGDPVLTHTTLTVPFTAPAVGTGFDSTISNSLDFWTGISVSDALNGIQVYQYKAKVITA